MEINSFLKQIDVPIQELTNISHVKSLSDFSDIVNTLFGEQGVYKDCSQSKEIVKIVKDITDKKEIGDTLGQDLIDKIQDAAEEVSLVNVLDDASEDLEEAIREEKEDVPIPRFKQSFEEWLKEKEKLQFEKSLEEWLADPEAKGEKQKAAKRIRSFFLQGDYDAKRGILDLKGLSLNTLPSCIGGLTNLLVLDLSENNLTSLPPEIGNLSNLEDLNLYENNLTSLPPEIGNLSNLEELNLSENNLPSLPPEIGNLSSLERLYLSENNLTSLPPEVGNLSSLERLSLSKNNLTSLPSEIGNRLNLYRLDVKMNPHLTELPMTLGNIPGLTFIDIEGTGISESARDIILESCQAKRKEGFKTQLPILLKRWFAFGKSDLKPEQFENLKENEKTTLGEWLTRLERTKDFRGRQQELTATVCRMLENLLTHEEFKELFFVQAEANNTACEDRSAMSLNEIYSSWKVTTQLKELSFKEQVEAMTKIAKTQALRRILGEKMSLYERENKLTLNEDVETYLYYEIRAKETNSVDLETLSKKMSYSGIGKRDWIDEKKLFQEVNDTYAYDFSNLPIFGEYFKNMTFREEHEAFVNAVEDIDEKYQELMFALEKPKQGELSKEDYENSELYLDWYRQYSLLNIKRVKERTPIVKKWLDEMK